MRLLVATTNPHKIDEIRALLGGLDLELVTLAGWPQVPAPEETGRTFAANARIKALAYARATGELTVAEDSGLVIDALDGAPGVESARYGGASASYPEKFALIYAELARRAAPKTDGERESLPAAARFECALALARGDTLVFEARGVVDGRIAPAPRGSGGFGYDPIFYSPLYAATLGEVTPEQKAAISHRGQAFRALRAFLQTHPGV